MAERLRRWLSREPSLNSSERDICAVRVQDALAQPHCPLCRLVDEGVVTRLQACFRELVNDPAQRDRLRGSLGYCRRHSIRVMEIGDALGLAILYHDLPGHALQRLETLSRGSPVRPPARCPECIHEEEDERLYAAALGAAMRDEATRRAYEEGWGLCGRHLELVMAAAPQEVRTFLAAHQGQRIGTLRGELAEFIRKADYRFAGEGLQDEADAPRRAVRRISGAPRPGEDARP